MIEVHEAMKIVEKSIGALAPQSLPVKQCLGLVLSDDVQSPIHLPPFRQSSMDGYALADLDSESYQLVAHIKAGDSGRVQLKKGQAARIFTGAAVPDSAVAIQMQEEVEAHDQLIHLKVRPDEGQFIRPCGEQVKRGEVILHAGLRLNEAALGLLSMAGITEVSVIPVPKISLLITGDELVAPGALLSPGEMYESNSITLSAGLERNGFSVEEVLAVKDDLKKVSDQIARGLSSSDVLVISGGISVGEHDHVREALLENGLVEGFYKVNQKPGKPLWFGTQNEKVVFALPGNPASSLTCLYLYVLPALKQMMGLKERHLPRLNALTESEIVNGHGKDLFLKGQYKDGKVTALFGQASSMLRSMAISNVLIHVPAETEVLLRGAEVECIVIRH